jgi:amino acid transporter
VNADAVPPTTTEAEGGPGADLRSVAFLAWPALAMLMVASVGSIAQLSDSASFGLGAVTVYLVPALLFLLPVGLVSAELATSHPGGIFVWVRSAYGDRTGFQATWFVFMNSVTLYPSLLSFGAAALASALGRPDLAENGAYMCTVVLVVFWLATFIVSRGMKSSTGISNLGLALGTIVPAMFLIFFMFAWLIDDRTSQIAFDVADVVPPMSGLSSIALVVGTFVAFAGLEVNAVHIAKMKGPPTNYLKAVLLAAGVVVSMYLLGSLAISVVVPDATLELTSGASQAFTIYADGFGVPGLSRILSGLLVLGALAASIAWIGGPSRSMWLVGRAGYLPKGLQRTNEAGIQISLLLLQGAVVSVLAFVFLALPNTSAAFALLQDVSISLYMLMYVCMFASAMRLRRRHPDVERPIRIPALPVIATVGMAAAVSAIVLGLTPPAGYSTMSATSYALVVATGVIVLAIPPQFIYRFRRPSWQTDPEAIDELVDDDLSGPTLGEEGQVQR